ncbi:MAG: tRNA (cytidine(34)-2'-O)-methyltransferase [Hydrogenophaga sp.]|nr:tRNA (cytidine(34)-2'-O)-methyltransferase [Hydrogenophaga sp.]
MFNVVLVTPEIPPNTGNVIRLCANTGCHLQAGLDYHEFAQVQRHADWNTFLAQASPQEDRLLALSTRGHGRVHEHRFEAGDWLVFGSETSGLPEDILGRFAPQRRLRLPMRPGQRSLNLSNAVTAVVFEAWRQQGFEGCAP